jgi:DNA-binding MarR family transcriptional regulator
MLGTMTASPDAVASTEAGPQASTQASTAEPRWLTGPEQDAWRAIAALMLQLPGPLDAQLQQDSGLTLFEYLVLSSLSMEPEHTARMSGLARLSNGSLSRLSNVAKRLEQRGWLRREPDPNDGRASVARLTDSGWQVVQAAAPGHVEAVRRLVIDRLTSPELDALTAAAHGIIDGLEEAGRACAGHEDPCAGAGDAPC